MAREKIRFVFNTGKTYTRKDLEGRPHLVVPASMLAEGVINGSKGPLYYDSAEIGKNPESWNGKPLVVYHPEMNGVPVSAQSPDIYDTHKIGYIFNSAFDEKLRTECWFDEERTKQVDERVYNAIINNQPMEISTGMEASLVKEKGEYKGIKYEGKIADIIPDHLAVLPDKVGAFSISMGGGLFANERFIIANTEQKWTAEKIANASLSVFGDPGTRQFPIEDQSDIDNAASLLHHAKDPVFVRNRLVRIAEAKGLKVPETWVQNALSFSDTERMLYKALASTYGEKGKEWSGWIVEVFDDSVIFCNFNGGTSPAWEHFQQSYSKTESSVSLSGTAVKVTRVTSYVPVRNQGDKEEVRNMAFDRKVHLALLVANAIYTQAEIAELEKLPDPILEKIPATKPTAAVQNPIQVPVVNNEPTAVTTNDWLKTAPPEIRQQFTRLLNHERQQKEILVNQITASPANRFQKEFLETQSLEMLQGIAAIASSATPAPQENGMFLPGTVFSSGPSFVGNAGAFPGMPNPAAGQPMSAPLETPDIFPAK